MVAADIQWMQDSIQNDAVKVACCQTDTLTETLSGVVVPLDADSVYFSQQPWWRQLWINGFRIHDPQVNYPRFPKFCLNVYDWGDRTFNSYDPEYVVGSGTNWKIMAKNYNWMESYMMLFSARSREMLHIRSDIHNDLGVYVSFMAVSIGYTAKLNSLINKTPSNSRNFNFNFTCSRFSFNLDLTSTKGDTRITHFGGYKGNLLPLKFNDISHKSTSGELYYFFNHRKYSQAAAYSFSKYQLKNAGTWIVGFAFTKQDIRMDFANLPQEFKEALPLVDDNYRFRYADYGLLGGYAQNWVLSPRRWLINLTVMPSIGYRHSYTDSSEGKKRMLASNIRARFALVYNHKALFVSLNGRIDSNIYFNSKYTFFNSIESLSLIVGARF